MVSYPIYNLKLDGWNRQSVWGWDPGRETLYAQLTPNSANFDASERGPQIWISPPRFPVIATPPALAIAIARATGTEITAVRTAMNDSLGSNDHPLWLRQVPSGLRVGAKR